MHSEIMNELRAIRAQMAAHGGAAEPGGIHPTRKQACDAQLLLRLIAPRSSNAKS